MAKLTIELIPSTSWGKNARTKLSPSIWRHIRTGVYADALYKCRICGSTGRLECHEVWEYDDEQHIQKLVGLQCLCTDCHLSKHFGRATAIGREEDAIRHMMHVNGWTRSQVDQHINNSLVVWNSRCAFEWTVDLGYLENR